jgi:alcohol dehydrogenase class IV
MKEQFDFQLKTKTSYGFGYSRNLPGFLAERGFSKVVLMVHEGVAQHSNYYQEIISLLEKSVDKLTIEILRGNEEPDYDYLDEVAEKVRVVPDVDVIIGIGGGSCLDITKAVALLKTNPGKGLEYRGFDHGKVPGVPVIAIPTTAGSGSEATINAVFTDKHEKKKLGINGINMDATYAILDAEWTLSCPFSTALSSGLDALVHSMESFMCHQANPLTRMYSREAFRLLYFALPCLVEDPTNREKRQHLILASYIAATGLFNSGSGIAGAISYPLGVHHSLPHGLGGGMMLLDVIEFNIERGYYEYSEFCDLVEPSLGLSVEEKSRLFLDLLRKLYAKLGVERYLDSWGITKENVEEVAKLLHPLQAAFDQNPVPFSAKEDALKILRGHVRS